MGDARGGANLHGQGHSIWLGTRQLAQGHYAVKILLNDPDQSKIPIGAQASPAMPQELDSRAFVVELALSDQFLTCMGETYRLKRPGSLARDKQSKHIDEQRPTRHSAGAPCTPLAK